MRTRRNLILLLSALFIGVAIFFANSESNAACSPADGTKCGDFGKNTITLTGITSITCNVSTSTTPVPCTRYDYTYTGTPTAIEVLIPKIVQTQFAWAASGSSPDSAAAGCSALLTNGQGESNGFGVNLFSYNLCKVAFPGPQGPGTFSIYADPSKDRALPWQEIVGTKTPGDALNGPALRLAEVAETGGTVNYSSGFSVKFTIVGGEAQLCTSGTPDCPNPPSARILPSDGSQLCVVRSDVDPNVALTVSHTSPSFSSYWVCDTVTWGTDMADLKVGRNTCGYKLIGGSKLWSCT